jgi:hypothetical protein
MVAAPAPAPKALLEAGGEFAQIVQTGQHAQPRELGPGQGPAQGFFHALPESRQKEHPFQHRGDIGQMGEKRVAGPRLFVAFAPQDVFSFHVSLPEAVCPVRGLPSKAQMSQRLEHFVMENIYSDEYPSKAQ